MPVCVDLDSSVQVVGVASVLGKDIVPPSVLDEDSSLLHVVGVAEGGLVVVLGSVQVVGDVVVGGHLGRVVDEVVRGDVVGKRVHELFDLLRDCLWHSVDFDQFGLH